MGFISRRKPEQSHDIQASSLSKLLACRIAIRLPCMKWPWRCLTTNCINPPFFPAHLPTPVPILKTSHWSLWFPSWSTCSSSTSVSQMFLNKKPTQIHSSTHTFSAEFIDHVSQPTLQNPNSSCKTYILNSFWLLRSPNTHMNIKHENDAWKCRANILVCLHSIEYQNMYLSQRQQWLNNKTKGKK